MIGQSRWIFLTACAIIAVIPVAVLVEMASIRRSALATDPGQLDVQNQDKYACAALSGGVVAAGLLRAGDVLMTDTGNIWYCRPWTHEDGQRSLLKPPCDIGERTGMCGDSGAVSK